MLLNQQQEIKFGYVMLILWLLSVVGIAFYQIQIEPFLLEEPIINWNQLAPNVLTVSFFVEIEVLLIWIGHFYLSKVIDESSYRNTILFGGLELIACLVLSIKFKRDILTSFWKLLDIEDRYFWGFFLPVLLSFLLILIIEIIFHKKIENEDLDLENHFIHLDKK